MPDGRQHQLLNSPGDSDDPLARLANRAVINAGDVLEPADVADVVLEAIADERFLILPHPAVLEMYRQKAGDYDRWLKGMRRYQHSLRRICNDVIGPAVAQRSYRRVAGIGLAVGERLAAAGANVVVTSRKAGQRRRRSRTDRQGAQSEWRHTPSTRTLPNTAST